ncbi:hypothetical protein OIU84_015828, partial [Salix udensis]
MIRYTLVAHWLRLRLMLMLRLNKTSFRLANTTLVSCFCFVSPPPLIVVLDSVVLFNSMESQSE